VGDRVILILDVAEVMNPLADVSPPA